MVHSRVAIIKVEGEFVNNPALLNLYFSDCFRVEREIIEEYGAFNISLLADLPLFIDPFLLFNSTEAKYRDLHDNILKYLRFLRDKAVAGGVSTGLLRAWYCFPEIKQNWLGFSADDNGGLGLGLGFARALEENLNSIFSNFGNEEITETSHLEKLCLIKSGVGRDKISDFTCNMIVDYLASYTEAFAGKYVASEKRKTATISKARFNYQTATWERRTYELPWYKDDYVLLTPIDMLTKDDTWINRTDLFDQFNEIPDAIPDEQLRAQVNQYFESQLSKNPTREEEVVAIRRTLNEFPSLIDYYIRHKEQHATDAFSVSKDLVKQSAQLYTRSFAKIVELLNKETSFYKSFPATFDEAYERVQFLKHVIEDKGGYRFFWEPGGRIRTEQDLHILFKLTWFGTLLDASAEVNDGQGPVDFKISRGAKDKTLVEFKLAKNTHLKSNLEKQTKIYEKASDAGRSIKVIFYFTNKELDRVNGILRMLGISGAKDIVLVDARRDNKPSGSKA